MPQLFLVGAERHHAGSHRIHVPKLDGEGKPEKGITTVQFVNGKADVDDNAVATWLKEKGHAAEILVPAYGLCQPGIGPVLEFDEGGNAHVAQPAQPAALPGAEPPKADDKKKGT